MDLTMLPVESIRQNVTEGQAGVPLHLEVQYIDITTCEPVPEVYVDIWNCNATGVYAGINVTGNVADGGWNSTFLRGIQATDSDGVVTFDTIFPVTHIGQLFWNEVLRSAIEETYPYNTNTQAVTSNADDMWSIVQAENDFDPFPEFMYLSDDITDGLLAWIQIGINTTADWSNDSYYSVAAVLQADGGHETSSGLVVLDRQWNWTRQWNCPSFLRN
ncbi:hypothetical protein DID88_009183 [Monilinia fructigena]|uniref:Intradiol ring-cleavage dioxygenases domain-containing protein n=1 Tax=Monilinia fructigena TaxID=38457 RepID=A0A395IK47_9HELO|nr:hypothetical protein DID88_009183 [Monilinia fructigena]